MGGDISGTPRGGRHGHGRADTGNAAAARLLMLAVPTTSWACVLAGALACGARPRPEAQWVIVPNVTSGDQIVCHLIPPAGLVAETI